MTQEKLCNVYAESELNETTWNWMLLSDILYARRTDIEAEFQRLKENQAKNSQQQEIQPRELMKGSVLKPLGISMGIMFFQQFTGINAMIFYTVSIFKSAGTTLDGRYATIIIGFVQLIATAGSGFLVPSH